MHNYNLFNLNKLNNKIISKISYSLVENLYLIINYINDYNYYGLLIKETVEFINDLMDKVCLSLNTELINSKLADIENNENNIVFYIFLSQNVDGLPYKCRYYSLNLCNLFSVDKVNEKTILKFNKLKINDSSLEILKNINNFISEIEALIKKYKLFLKNLKKYKKKLLCIENFLETF
jgi:hypothetical protein